MSLQFPTAILKRFPPSEGGLLSHLSRNMSAEMLLEIANSDHGNGVHENTAALDEICRAGKAPEFLPWHPREVLSLTRWSEPTDHDQIKDYCDTKGHTKRAFSCAVLVAWDFKCEYGDRGDSLVQLVYSCLILGRTETELLGQLLTWLGPQLVGYDDALVLIPFALLVVLLRLDGTRTDQQLPEQAVASIFEGVKQHSIACFGEETQDSLEIDPGLRRSRWLSLAKELKRDYPSNQLIESVVTLMFKSIRL